MAFKPNVLTHPKRAVKSFTYNLVKVNSTLFTIHQPFTTYHNENKRKKNSSEQCEQFFLKKLFSFDADTPKSFVAKKTATLDSLKFVMTFHNWYTFRYTNKS